jgi:hypothetical protein
MKFSSDKSYDTGLDIEMMRKVDTFHNTSEEEKGTPGLDSSNRDTSPATSASPADDIHSLTGSFFSCHSNDIRN